MYKKENINTVGQDGSANTWITIVLVVIIFHVIVVLSVVGFNLLKGGNEIPKGKEIQTSKELKPSDEVKPLNLPPEESRSLEQALSTSDKTKIPAMSDEDEDETEKPQMDLDKLIASLDSSSEPAKKTETLAVAPSETEAHSKPVKTASSPEVPGNCYIVVEGDTLSKVATKTGVSIDEIRKRNRLDKDVVKIGQKLIIPGKSDDKAPALVASTQGAGKQAVNAVTVPPKPLMASAGAYKTYRIGKGDTLTKIATLYHISPEKLAKINDISDPGKLKAGMEIKVPRE